MLQISTPPPIVSPAPASTSCADGQPRYRDATATHLAMPVWPRGLTVSSSFTLDVGIDLDETGKVTKATIVSRTAKIDNADLQKRFDQAAMDAAVGATYLPKVVDCVPVKSHYVFRVTYSPGAQ